MAYATADSPIGPLLVAATPAGLVRLGFQTEDRDDILEDLAERVSPRVLEAPARLDEARRELDEYFEGRRDHFELPLDWQLSRGFRKTVLERLYADVELRPHRQLPRAGRRWSATPRPAAPSAPPWPPTPSRSSSPATGCSAPAATSAATAAASPSRQAPRARAGEPTLF